MKKKHYSESLYRANEEPTPELTIMLDGITPGEYGVRRTRIKSTWTFKGTLCGKFIYICSCPEAAMVEEYGLFVANQPLSKIETAHEDVPLELFEYLCDKGIGITTLLDIEQKCLVESKKFEIGWHQTQEQNRLRELARREHADKVRAAFTSIR